MILPEATRVAMPLASAGNTRDVRIPALWQFTAHELLKFECELGKGLRIGVNLLVPFRLGFLTPSRVPAGNAASAGSGMRNAGSTGQPRFCLVSLTSSTPSGEPCASKLSCLFGEP